MALPIYVLFCSALLGASASVPTVLPGFDNPVSEHRPKFRYWLPDASVDLAQVTQDVQALKDVGAGGVEFNAFYNYGFGDPTLPPTNAWDMYGFGTPAFKEVLLTALRESGNTGLRFDFSLGASEGQGAPVEPLTPGLAVQLAYGEVTVKAGQVFSEPLPDPHDHFNFLSGYMHEQERFGPDRLIGVVAGGVVSTKATTGFYSETILDESSLVDLTESLVGGKLNWTAPSDHDDYKVFAFYEQYTNQRSCNGVADPANAVANGSWIVDHFSGAGASLVVKFWETTLLDDEVRQLLRDVGEHTWEDSMEMQASLFWTPDLLRAFEQNRGYSLAKYLPLLFHQSNAYSMTMPPYNTTYVLDPNASDQNKYIQDYRTTLNEGYMEYLRTYEKWAESLGLTHSCQVAYNLPLDMAGDIPLVGGPELESLGFPEIDMSLQFVGPAHLSSRNVISTEVGAVQTGAYTQSVPSLVALFRDAFAAGVNEMVIHGMQYSGEYMAATWPGYTPFQYAYTELWSPRQPAWRYLNDTMAYVARNQLVLRAGTPKRDVAFYLYKEPWKATDFYDGADLRAEGYTHEYLGPANLAAEEAIVSDGVLAKAGPAYGALVFYNQTYITPEASVKVLDFAKKGLPILVYGGFPNTTVGANGQETVSDSIAALTSGFPNVQQFGYEVPLQAALKSLSVQPRLSVHSEPGKGNLYSVWRSSGNVDFVFLYNRAESGIFELTIKTGDDKFPYLLDAWLGEQQELIVYQRSEKGISMSVSLKERQTAILAFSAAPRAGGFQVVSHSANIEKVQLGKDNNKMAVFINNPDPANLTLENGEKREVPGLPRNASLPNFEVGPWNLTIESWVPSSDPSTSYSVIDKLALGPQKSLVPWSEIPVAQNVSGIGIYTATFTLQRNCLLNANQAAVLIQFGPVLNTLRAWVSGRLLPPADLADAEVDISDYVVPGENDVRVEVSSTLFNAVKARVDWVKNMGMGPINPYLYSGADWQAYGLVGPVSVKVLRKVELS